MQELLLKMGGGRLRGGGGGGEAYSRDSTVLPYVCVYGMTINLNRMGLEITRICEIISIIIVYTVL